MISLWWEILKNAKISGKTKGKGSTLDASKIKINIDKNDCKRELKKILSNALAISPLLQNQYRNYVEEEYIDNELSEERACAFVKVLKYRLPKVSQESPLLQRMRDGARKNDYPESLKFDVGSYPSNFVKNHSVILKVTSDETTYVKLMGPDPTMPDDWKMFAYIGFRTSEEYDKWVKSI